MRAERIVVQNAVFRGKMSRQFNFESATFIVEKFCCHCAGSYLRIAGLRRFVRIARSLYEKSSFLRVTSIRVANRRAI